MSLKVERFIFGYEGRLMTIILFENTPQGQARMVSLQKAALPHLPLESVAGAQFAFGEVLKHTSCHGYWVFEHEGEWVGYASAFVPWFWAADNVLLCRLGVHPKFRKKGIGTQLLKHLVSFAQRESCIALGGDIFDLYPDASSL